MPLPLTEEQTQLRDTVRGWLADSYSLATVRDVFEGKRAPLTLAELSALGLQDAFTFDATGWGFRELGLVAFEVGYALAPSSIMLGLLPSALNSMSFNNGQHTVTFGEKTGSTEEAKENGLDRTQYVRVKTASAADTKHEDHAYHAAHAVLANEAAGVCAKVIAFTQEYVTTRKQFGRAIGTFQAVQHKLADLFVSSEALRTTAEFAAWSGSHAPQQFAFSATAARTLASEITVKVVQGCIQLHGGIGFTWEHDLHFFLRRAQVLRAVLKTDVHAVSLLLAGPENRKES